MPSVFIKDPPDGSTNSNAFTQSEAGAASHMLNSSPLNQNQETPRPSSQDPARDSCGVRESRKEGRASMTLSAPNLRRRNQSETKLEQGHVFVDADAMKEKVRKNLAKPKHDVKDYYKSEGVWQLIATSYMFEMGTLAVITANAVWIAVDTDLNHAAILLESEWPFQLVEHLFCIFFSFEWITRFMSFQHKRHCAKDAWFVFDSILVSTMILETWVMSCVILLTGPSGTGGGGNASVLRVARLLRLSRMARMVRLLRAMPELMIMIKGMVAASRSVLFTLLLLILLMYVFAVAMTQLLDGTDVGDKYFDSVLRSMYTLWLYGTLLDDVGVMANRLLKESPVYLGVYFLYILLAALTVMNMLIGVLCEVVSATAATEKEEMLVSYVNEKLRSVVKLIDQDGSMSISKTEFKQILENAQAARCLQDVGVDVVNLVDLADAIFTDDSGEEEMELSFPKFMEVVLNLRGSNHATVKDIVELRKFIRKVMPRATTYAGAGQAGIGFRNSVRDTVREELRSQLQPLVDQVSLDSDYSMDTVGKHALKAAEVVQDSPFREINGGNRLLHALPAPYDAALTGPWMPLHGGNGKATMRKSEDSQFLVHRGSQASSKVTSSPSASCKPSRAGSSTMVSPSDAVNHKLWDASSLAEHQEVSGLTDIPDERYALPWSHLAPDVIAEVQWKLKHADHLKVVLVMALQDLDKMIHDEVVKSMAVAVQECADGGHVEVVVADNDPQNLVDQKQIPNDTLQGVNPAVAACAC